MGEWKLKGRYPCLTAFRQIMLKLILECTIGSPQEHWASIAHHNNLLYNVRSSPCLMFPYPAILFSGYLLSKRVPKSCLRLHGMKFVNYMIIWETGHSWDTGTEKLGYSVFLLCHVLKKKVSLWRSQRQLVSISWNQNAKDLDSYTKTRNLNHKEPLKCGGLRCNRILF